MRFKFSNVFVPAETVILGCSFVVFWPELPKMSILFKMLTSVDMQNNPSNLLQFLLKYKEIVKTSSKSWFFSSFCEFSLCFSSYTLWVTPQHFGKWNTLLRYISVVSFISIAFVFGKLKIFKAFRNDSAAIKWSLLGGFWALLPQLLFDYAEILNRGSLLAQMECTQSLHL